MLTRTITITLEGESGGLLECALHEALRVLEKGCRIGSDSNEVGCSYRLVVEDEGEAERGSSQEEDLEELITDEAWRLVSDWREARSKGCPESSFQSFLDSEVLSDSFSEGLEGLGIEGDDAEGAFERAMEMASSEISN